MNLGSRIAAWFGEDKEEAMYKEMWEMLFKEGSGVGVMDFSKIDGNSAKLSYQRFRGLGITEFIAPFLTVSSSYSIGNCPNLTRIVVGAFGNNQYAVDGCSSLRDITVVAQTKYQFKRNSALVNLPRLCSTTELHIHCSDGDLDWDEATQSYVDVPPSAASANGGGYKCLISSLKSLWRRFSRVLRNASKEVRV